MMPFSGSGYEPLDDHPIEVWACPVDPTAPPQTPPGFTSTADRYPYLIAHKAVQWFTDPDDHVIDLTGRSAGTAAQAAAVPAAAALSDRRCTAARLPARLTRGVSWRTHDALTTDQRRLATWSRYRFPIDCDLAHLLVADDHRWPKHPTKARLLKATEHLGNLKCLLAADGTGTLLLRIRRLTGDHHTHLSIALDAARAVGLDCALHVLAIPAPSRRTQIETANRLLDNHRRVRHDGNGLTTIEMLAFVEGGR